MFWYLQDNYFGRQSNWTKLFNPFSKNVTLLQSRKTNTGTPCLTAFCLTVPPRHYIFFTHGKLVWKHSAPHLTFTKRFVVNKSLLLDVQGYHYHLYWIILNRISTFLEYILIFVYYLKNQETSILISFPLSILSCETKISADWYMLKCVYPSEKHHWMTQTYCIMRWLGFPIWPKLCIF